MRIYEFCQRIEEKDALEAKKLKALLDLYGMPVRYNFIKDADIIKLFEILPESLSKELKEYMLDSLRLIHFSTYFLVNYMIENRYMSREEYLHFLLDNMEPSNISTILFNIYFMVIKEIYAFNEIKDAFFTIAKAYLGSRDEDFVNASLIDTLNDLLRYNKITKEEKDAFLEELKNIGKDFIK